MKMLTLALLVAACSRQPRVASTKLALAVAGDLSSCGALPSDNKDDRECAQQVVDTLCARGGGVINFSAGVYQFTADPRPGAAYIPSLRIGCSNIRLTGTGYNTVLEATGDAGHTDYNLIQIGGPTATSPSVENTEVDHLRLSGGALMNTEEQTHLIQVGKLSGARNTRLHHLWFWHPIRHTLNGAMESGGDCIRLLGEAATPVVGTEISHSSFLSCDRSSIAFQREVYSTVISDSFFYFVGDQWIDQEPSGRGGLSNNVISNNQFLGADGNIGIALTGNGASATSTTRFLGNTIIGRTLYLSHLSDTTIAGNYIEAVAYQSATVTLFKTTQRVKIEQNTIKRSAGSPPGAVVNVVHHNGMFPGDVSVAHNYLRNEVDGNILVVESAQHVTVEGNDLEFVGPTPSKFTAVLLQSSGQAMDDILVANNHVRGLLGNAVFLAASPLKFGSAQVTGNKSQGAVVGLRCSLPANFTKPVVHALYYYENAAEAILGCTGVTLVPQYP